jgi:MoaA/NifB/PqqE/SkfB family radical SAM enzyme
MKYLRNRGNRIVAGVSKHPVKVLLWATILFLALLRWKSPAKSIANVTRMIRLRGSAGHTRTTFKYVRAAGRWFWDLYSPGWPSASFRTYIRQSLNLAAPAIGETGLQAIVFGVTRQCPLACDHCSESQTRNTPDPLDLNALKRVLDVFLEYGVSQIQFSGGEPLVRWLDLCSLMEHGGNGVDYWILTSGYGLTKEKASTLKESGLTGISLSCDSWNEKEHVRFRHSESAFSWMSTAAENAREVGLVLCLTLCAMPSFITRENLDRYAALAVSLGAGFIQVLEPRRVGGFAEKNVALAPDQLTMLDEFYERMNFDRRSARMPAVCYHGYNQRRVGCFGAGRRYLYVDAAGDVHACPFCKGSVGNCLNEPLGVLLQRLKKRGCHAFAGNSSIVEIVSAAA